jgi:hypothetical protein
VPLIEQQGHLEKVSAHWFENEGVAYVFFSVAEDPELLQRSYWQMRYTLRTAAGGTELHDWARIDFNAGVHEHAVVPCGFHRLCGSYSFKTALPLDTFSLRLDYDPESTLFLEQDAASVQAHAKGTDWTQHSALLFGVFDRQNQHVQARVHHNFGDPSSDEIPQYGMKRRFRVRDPGLHDAADEDVAAAIPTNSDFLFDSTLCTAAPAGAVVADFSGESTWMPDAFATETAESGVCFTADLLDKAGATLYTGSAFARKNPELANSSYTFETPLKDATKLPIVLRYCEDDPQFGKVTDATFFDYQRYITNVPDRPVDLCFKVGAETEFKDAFQRQLAARLTEAKAKNEGAHDFVFVIIFHQDLSTEFRKFHQIIAESLAALIDGESANVTPRLVGAFVYDSRVDFRPTAAQRKGIIWCPQELPTGLDPARFAQPDGLSDNCLVTPTAKLDLTVINFVTPLGPFPTLKNYQDYVKKYGDRGTSHAPHLNFSSVPTGPNTRQETGETVTFFDGERLVVNPGEIVRLCLDRGQPEMLPDLRFRVLGTPDSEPSLKISEVAALWQAGTTEATEYQLGVAWEFPFVGREDYEATLSGNVVAVIPFQKSSTTYEQLGNAKWLREKWPVGDSLEICHRFCGHPYFDEGGVYQIHAAWKERSDFNCPAAVYPKIEGAA